MGFDWFDLEGFLVADRPDGNGLLGSCWTKIHRTTEPVLGEIYVISVDPALHGQGWGRALTVAGLQWMASQGVTVGMLYVTGSNTGRGEALPVPRVHRRPRRPVVSAARGR